MSRFDPTNDELRESLRSHAKITLDLQNRIVEARRAAASHPAILQILDTPHAPESAGMVPAARLAEAWDEAALWAAVECGAIEDEAHPWLTPGDNPYRATGSDQ